jgi:hypothetical protein
MDKAIADKVRKCKKLQGKNMVDVMDMRQFQDNLAAYWTQQRESRLQVERNYKLITKPVPAHPIANLMNLSVKQLMLEYLAVINGTSTRTSSERLYIKQLCQQAYNLTVAQIVCKEFPELEPELLPKAKAN